MEPYPWDVAFFTNLIGSLWYDFCEVIVDKGRKYKLDTEKNVQKNKSLALKEVIKLSA